MSVLTIFSLDTSVCPVNTGPPNCLQTIKILKHPKIYLWSLFQGWILPILKDHCVRVCVTYTCHFK